MNPQGGKPIPAPALDSPGKNTPARPACLRLRFAAASGGRRGKPRTPVCPSGYGTAPRARPPGRSIKHTLKAIVETGRGALRAKARTPAIICVRTSIKQHPQCARGRSILRWAATHLHRSQAARSGVGRQHPASAGYFRGPGHSSTCNRTPDCYSIRPYHTLRNFSNHHPSTHILLLAHGTITPTSPSPATTLTPGTNVTASAIA